MLQDSAAANADGANKDLTDNAAESNMTPDEIRARLAIIDEKLRRRQTDVENLKA